MTTMVSEIYDALMSAGADEKKARKAAEAMADRRDDMTLIKADISILKADVSANNSKLGIIMWVLGVGFTTIFAMLIPMFWKLFSLN